jgi:hypothetical protein
MLAERIPFAFFRKRWKKVTGAGFARFFGTSSEVLGVEMVGFERGILPD